MTLKHFADIEVARRRSETNLRTYSARDKVAEEEEKQQKEVFQEFEKDWTEEDIERENKRREELEAQGLTVTPPGQPTVGTGGGRSNRAQIVKRIMQEKGLSMIEASKYVKSHNLY
jgi:hypothetical protein